MNLFFLNRNKNVVFESLGQIINSTVHDDFYIYNPASTITINDGIIHFNKNVNYDQYDYVLHNYIGSALENFIVDITGKCNIKGNGFAVWLQAFQEIYKFSWTCKFNLDGHNIISSTNTGGWWSDRATSEDVLTFSIDDIINLKMKRDYNVITSILTNNTTNQQLITTFTVNYNELTYIQPTLFKFGIYLNGGNWDITNFSVTSTNKKDISLLCIGDSITQGLSEDDESVIQTDNNYRYAYLYQLHNRNKCIEVHAGGGAKVADLLLTTDEIQRINPKNVTIMLGTNGIDYIGYQELVSTLEGFGANVFPLTIPGGSTIYNNWILSTFEKSIDAFTGFDSSHFGYGPHPNKSGHQLIYNNLRQSGKIKL
jgi:hypothetical protein